MQEGLNLLHKPSFMKPLHQLTNKEKALLLHRLFPQEIPGFLNYMENFAITFQEDQQTYKQLHDGELFPFAFWLEQATQAVQKIKRYGGLLQSRSKRFAYILFGGDIALLSIRCLVTYCTTRQHRDRKFVAIVDILFKP